MRSIKYLLFLLFYCSTTATWAQQPNYTWTKGAGGDHILGHSGVTPDLLHGMATDKEGNTYISGSTVEFPIMQDTVLSPPLGGFGNNDAVIAKYDKCGRLVWFHIYGARDDDRAYGVNLSPDQNYFIATFTFGMQYPQDSVKVQLSNKDTFVKVGPYVAKVSTVTGKILQIHSLDYPYPTGGTYNLEHDFVFLSGNRIVSYVYGTGNFDGKTWNDNDGHMAVLDSNLRIVRWALLDTGVSFLYGTSTSYGHRPVLYSDRFGNIYGTLFVGYNGSSTSIQVFDSVFHNFDNVNGDGLIFQTDSNLSLKRYIRTDVFSFFAKADEKIYATGFAWQGQLAYIGSDTIVAVSNLSGPGQQFIYELDTSFHLVRGCMGDAAYIHAPPNLILQKDKVFALGVGFGEIQWGGDTVPPQPGSYEILTWEIPKSTLCPVAYHMTIPFVVNNIYHATIQASSDEQGNIYIAGSYTTLLYTSDDTIAANGGASSPDIFVMKWGFECNDSLHSLAAPIVPSSLVATATGIHSVRVTWEDNSQYELSFHIYRSPDGVSNWTMIDTVLRNTTQYMDVNVQPNTAYWYKAAAWNENGESDVTNIDSAMTWLVGILEESKDLPYVNLYPNPARDGVYLEVTSTETSNADIRVIDINGSVVMAEKWNLMTGYNQEKLYVGQLVPGIYYVTISTGKSLVTKKLVRME